MIMNRLSLHNLTEPITKDLDYTLQEPFLLYKTAKAICGIWFYNRNDCIRFAELIQRLLAKIRQEEKVIAPSMTAATDIMSMLSKAQHEYKQGTKKKRSVSESGPSPIGPGGDGGGGGGAGVIRPIPVKVSPGHVSKTEDQMSARGGAKPKTSPMGPRFQRSVSMQDTRTMAATTTSSVTTTAGQGDGSKVIPVLQRLMSQGTEERPVITEKGQIHTLESLEKMHTILPTEGSSTPAGKKPEVQSLESIESLHIPSGGASDKRPSAAAAGTAGAPSSAESSHHLQRLLQRLQSGTDTAQAQGLIGAAPSSTSAEPSPQKEVPEKVPSPSQQTDMNQALLDKLKSGTAVALPVNLLKPSSATLTPNLLVSQSASGTADPSRAPPAMKQLFPAPKEARKTPSPPTTIQGVPSNLLTPELLRTRLTSESALISPLKLSGSVQAGQSQPVGKRGPTTPLTKEQLADTLVHLLRTDDDFLSKIHSAYTHSLQRLPP
ncbi:mRNA-decapping enzyme 1B-like [Lytechinus pictus]|uniref:mRNA-decapping enzyme 1B-like n=1 Tax=Lytechinus pictus TaxID=7653 RepID=UPI0030BA223C